MLPQTADHRQHSSGTMTDRYATVSIIFYLRIMTPSSSTKRNAKIECLIITSLRMCFCEIKVHYTVPMCFTGYVVSKKNTWMSIFTFLQYCPGGVLPLEEKNWKNLDPYGYQNCEKNEPIGIPNSKTCSHEAHRDTRYLSIKYTPTPNMCNATWKREHHCTLISDGYERGLYA